MIRRSIGHLVNRRGIGSKRKKAECILQYIPLLRNDELVLRTRRCCRGVGLLCISPIEPLHTSRRVHQLLFSCKKRMTVRTNFDMDVAMRRPSFKCISADTGDDRLLILRMYSFFHQILLVPLLKIKVVFKKAQCSFPHIVTISKTQPYLVETALVFLNRCTTMIVKFAVRCNQILKTHFLLFKRYFFATPITPHASRPPALPVGCVLRSSSFSCTITARPTIEVSPWSLSIEST